MQVILIPLLLAASAVAAAQSSEPARTPWQMQESGTTAGLRGIDSVDGRVAWASGTGGTVLKTLDGGAHWTQCAIPDGATDGATLDFRGVQAWDAVTAIVMASGPGEKSRLYKTTDGCKTWKLEFKNPDKDGFWDGLMSDMDDMLFVLGDPVRGNFVLFSQVPGGKWLRGWNGHEIVAAPKEAAFAASNSVLIEGGKGSFCFVTGGSKTEIIQEIHGIDDKKGLYSDWSHTTLPLAVGESAGAFSIASVQLSGDSSHDVIVVVGGDYKRPVDSTGTAAFSSDWGSTWIASATPPHGFRSAVQWSEALKVWITVGTNGSDISRDDGKTWKPIDDGNWNALSLPFAVGPNGRIARLNPAALPHSMP
jgi:photosystem II stability/assembly factor-like uncharacterized protein